MSTRTTKAHLLSALDITQIYTPTFGNVVGLEYPQNQSKFYTVDDVTDASIFQSSISSGSAIIDLFSLVGVNGKTFSANGKLLVAAKFYAPTANQDEILVNPADPDGFLMFGSANLWNFALSAGQSVLVDLANTPAAISLTSRYIELVGNVDGDKLNIALLFTDIAV